MNRMTTTRTAQMAMAMMVSLTLGITACQTTTEEPVVEEVEVTETVVPESTFRQGEMEEPPEPTTRASVDLGTVYFDFDKSEIRGDARPILRANAEALRTSGLQVTVEGHCDERGSEEYNYALGQRRADSVKKYMINLGVPGSQMRTVSYGETRPAVMGHNESAWRYNRRGAFVVDR